VTETRCAVAAALRPRKLHSLTHHHTRAARAHSPSPYASVPREPHPLLLLHLPLRLHLLLLHPLLQ
jgi:hypothetical protein